MTSSPKTVQSKPNQQKAYKGLTEKQKRESEFLDFLHNSNDSQENAADSDEEEAEKMDTGDGRNIVSDFSEPIEKIMTEEEFLKQQNLNMKLQLLEDSSSESDLFSDDSDVESVACVEPKKPRRSKAGSVGEDDSDDSASTSNDSYESLVDKFLEKTTDKEAKETDPNDNTAAEVGKNKEATSEASSSEIAKKSTDADEKLLHQNEEKDQPSTSSSKPKSTITLKPFSKLEKELFAAFSSDDSDDESKSSKAVSSNSTGSEILDTSMFKTKQMEMDSNRLSEMLSSAAKRKTSTTRETPDECISLSSDDDLEVEPVPVEAAEQKEAAAEDSDDKHKDRTVRKLLRSDQLAGETKKAQREESERIKRLEKKNKRLQQIIKERKEKAKAQQKDSDEVVEVIEDVILDYDTEKKELIMVHRDILKHLKSHQTEGIKFMYDCCYGSVDSIEQHQGSGCILAHCMGLGKTLQLISLLHTVISYPQLKTTKVLVICPKSTVLNWKEEIERWLSPIKNGRRLKLYQFQDPS